MPSIKPITLYAHGSGPNPWKTVIILEELGIPYTTKFMDMGDMKKEPYIKVNPNGRVPAIEDPNTGIVLWESGAINEYLVDQYDQAGKLTYRQAPEKYYLQQWLHFQMSGQGPYYGQAAWFTHFHSEEVPSARQRYLKEMERVIGVLDNALAGKQWLVGDKCTYADLAFVTWHGLIPFILKEDKIDIAGKYPNYNRWIEAMLARPAVRKTMDDKAAAMKQH